MEDYSKTICDIIDELILRKPTYDNYTMQRLGKIRHMAKTMEDIIIEVDKILYDISNQWEDGMDIEELIADIRKLMCIYNYAGKIV